MGNLIYFTLWEVALGLLVIFLYFVLNKKKLRFIHLIFLWSASLIFGYITFYHTFELDTKINIKRYETKLNEEEIDKYNLKIDEQKWIVEECKKEGIQIGTSTYSLINDVASYILMNTSENKTYDGRRKLIVDSSYLVLEEEHNYNNIKFSVKQYTYNDGTSELYGKNYYNPYYIFKFKLKDLYYSIRIINSAPSKEMIYAYGMDKIRYEELIIYLNYISSIVNLT